MWFPGSMANIEFGLYIVCIIGELPAVLYERQKSRNTEQANSSPEVSQSETPITSVFQAPLLAEELHSIDADCDLNYDVSSSETHSNPHKSKFALYYLTPYCDKLSFYDT